MGGRSYGAPSLLRAVLATAGALLCAGAGDSSGVSSPRPRAEGEFRLLDQDGDGYLSAAELRPKEGLSMAEDGERYDQDGDGRLSPTEFAVVLERPEDSVAAATRTEPDLSRFTEALERTGLAAALEHGGPYTLFVPVNEAFDPAVRDAPDEQHLVKLLRAHIVADDVDRDLAARLGSAMTVDGNVVALERNGDTLQVGPARVVGPDIRERGVRIYPIDGVLGQQENGPVGQ